MKNLLIFFFLLFANLSFCQTENNKINIELGRVKALMEVGEKDYNLIKLKLDETLSLGEEMEKTKDKEVKKSLFEKLKNSFGSINEDLYSINRRYEYIENLFLTAIKESRRLNCNELTSALGKANAEIFVIKLNNEEIKENVNTIVNGAFKNINSFASNLLNNYTKHLYFTDSFNSFSKYSCKEVKTPNINLEIFSTAVFETCANALLIKNYKEAKRAEEQIFIDLIFEIYKLRKKYPLLRNLIKKKYPNKDDFSVDQLYVSFVFDQTISNCKKAQELISEKLGTISENEDLISLNDSIKKIASEYNKYESLSDYDKEKASYKMRDLIRNYSSSYYTRNKVIAYLLVNSAEYREYRAREVASLKIRQMKNGWYPYID